MRGAAAPFAFGAPPPRRRPGLTPMIDVIFLLVVFFLLAARFGAERALPLAAAGGAGGWEGPPRLLEVGPEALILNGAPVAAEGLAAALGRPGPVVVRPVDGAELQRLVAVAEALAAAGHGPLYLVE